MGDLRRLQYLRISGICFPLYALPFRALTHLTIRRIPEPLPIISFFAALRAMPALQSLQLVNSLPETYAIEDIEPISLPNLQHLCISFLIVSHVVIVPVKTVVSLRTGPDDRFVSSLSDFFLSMDFGKFKKPSYRHLQITGRGCLSMTLTGTLRLGLFFSHLTGKSHISYSVTGPFDALVTLSGPRPVFLKYLRTMPTSRGNRFLQP